MASPANIRLGWKGLPRKNALVFYGKSYLAAVNVLQHWRLEFNDCLGVVVKVESKNAEAKRNSKELFSFLIKLPTVKILASFT
jgi:hypothetical protein